MKVKLVIKKSLRRSKDDVRLDIYTLYYRLSYFKEKSFINTGVKIKEKYFDNENQLVIGVRNAADINEQLNNMREAIVNLTYKNPHITSKELKTKFAEYESNMPAVELQNNTFLSYFKLYFSSKNYEDRLHSQRTYEDLKAWAPNLDLNEWSFQKVDEFVSFLNKSRRASHGQPYSKNTIAKKLKHVRRAINAACRDNLMDMNKNPFAKGYRLPGQESRDFKLDLQQMREFKANHGLKNYHTKAFLLAFYLDGMRFGDICRLKWEMFDRVNQMLHTKSSKTLKQKAITYGPEVELLLCNIESTIKTKNGYLFPYFDECDMSEQAITTHKNKGNSNANSALKKVSKAMGLNFNITMHVARHTFAYLSYKNGMNLLEIQDALGHSDPKITRDYIGKLVGDDLANQRSKLHAVI